MFEIIDQASGLQYRESCIRPLAFSFGEFEPCRKNLRPESRWEVGLITQ